MSVKNNSITTTTMTTGTPIFFKLTISKGEKAQRGTFIREGEYGGEAVVADADGNEYTVQTHRINRVPQMGLYANNILHTDAYAYEIVEVRTENKVMIRKLDATLKPEWKPEIIPGGFSGHCTNNRSQEWDYAPNDENKVIAIRRRKDGRFYDKHGSRYAIDDSPYRFHDYNF